VDCRLRDCTSYANKRKLSSVSALTYLILMVHILILCPFSLLKFLNPGVLSILPTSHQTIREWVVRTFGTQKRRIQQVLQSAISRIHFTVDIWSSPNKLGILGIVAHFVDSNGELVSYCVALREVHGRHSGENQAHIVMNVVEDYGIVTQIGYFVSDNADSNDTLMNSLQKCTSLSIY
jgi:hypothetical protein